VKLRNAMKTANEPVYFAPDDANCAQRIVNERLAYACSNEFECYECLYTHRGCELELIQLSEEPTVDFALLFPHKFVHLNNFNNALMMALDEFTSRRDQLLHEFDPCNNAGKPYLKRIMKSLDMYNLSGDILLFIVGTTLSIFILCIEKIIDMII
jgi:hypothetical protein